MNQIDDVWLTGGWVFDGTGEPRYRGDVRTRSGKIVEIARSEHGEASGRTGQEVDVTGATLLPGLIDAHTHVGLLKLQGQNTLPPAVQAASIFRNLSLSLDQGFTTLRDLGGVDGGLVKAVELGLVEGPRILPSGEIISQTAGHGDYRSRYGHEKSNPDLGAGGLVVSMRIADGVAGVQKAARDQFRRGATQLKVFASGGQLSEGDPIDAPQYSEQELAAAVVVAQDRGTYVTVHAHTAYGIQRALRAGVRCFEHATVLDEETVQLMKEYGAVAVPTLTVSEMLREDPAAWGVLQEWLKDSEWLDQAAVKSIQMMDEAGIPMGSGADLVGLNQDNRGWEISLKADILGGSKAIQSATRVNAEILGIADTVGTLEVGKVADIVAFGGDSVAGPRRFHTDRPVLVMKEGILV